MIHVRQLRHLKLARVPVIYNWWFKESAAKSLIAALVPHIDISKIKKIKLEGEIYWLLYVGKAKDAHQRLVEYHIMDKNKFHSTGVANGRLSSLRQTLCGLHGWQMSTSKELVDRFIDDNCLVEYKVITREQLILLEVEAITSAYPVLNSKSTAPIFSKEHRKVLGAKKKTCKR